MMHNYVTDSAISLPAVPGVAGVINMRSTFGEIEVYACLPVLPTTGLIKT